MARDGRERQHEGYQDTPDIQGARADSEAMDGDQRLPMRAENVGYALRAG